MKYQQVKLFDPLEHGNHKTKPVIDPQNSAFLWAIVPKNIFFQMKG